MTPALEIDLRSGTPVYRQIVDSLRRILVAGQVRPGEALPPVRQLALDLGVHFNTVAQAYRLLAEEGWLDVRQGRGATVVERPGRAAPPGWAAELRRRMEDQVAEYRARGAAPGEIAMVLCQVAQDLEEAGRVGA